MKILLFNVTETVVLQRNQWQEKRPPICAPDVTCTSTFSSCAKIDWSSPRRTTLTHALGNVRHPSTPASVVLLRITRLYASGVTWSKTTANQQNSVVFHQPTRVCLSCITAPTPSSCVIFQT